MFRSILTVSLGASILIGELAAQVQPSIAFDRLGNSYTLDQISYSSGSNALMGGGPCNPCNAGIFQLHFEAGSGMEIPGPVGDARRDVAVQVFKDLSVLLEPAGFPYSFTPDVPNDPWSPSSSTPLVKVDFIPTTWIPQVDWTTAMGVGSTLYNAINHNSDNPALPPWQIFPYDDFTPSTPVDLRSGILDGEVWRTINGGVDSWKAMQKCFLRGGTTTALTVNHGVIALNFSGTPADMYTGMSLSGLPAGDADMYMVLAHEAMHMLEFASLTRPSGAGFFNMRYYSRYDKLLHEGGVPWVVDPNDCGNWNGNLNGSVDLTPGACIMELSGANTTPSLPVWAPATWSGSSLSHLDGTCVGGQPYLMHWTNIPGQPRIPWQEEVNVLCDMDYHTTSEHGFSGSGWDGTYATRSSCGMRIGGVDDLFADYSTREYYQYKQGQLMPLTIANFLSNDEDQSNTSVGVIGTPTSYSCLQVLVGGDGGSLPPVTGGTSFAYVPDPGFVGYAVLRYRPVSSDGREGNYTFIFIEVWPPDICASQSCNILNGGGFEGTPFVDWQVGPHENVQVITNGTNTPDLFAVNPMLAAPNNWINLRGFHTLESSCAGTGQPAVDSHNGSISNGRYVDLALSAIGSPQNEEVLFELCRPLIPGNTYTAEFWGYTGGTCNGGMRFYAFDTRPCNQSVEVSGALPVFACNGVTHTGVPLTPAAVTFSGGWAQHTALFTYSGPTDAHWVLAVAEAPMPRATLQHVDDFAIHPQVTADAIVLPACNGQHDGSITLDVNYYLGSYSILWSTGATTATIMGLAPGTYTVTIVDTDLGCASLTESYVVGDAACAGNLTITKSVVPSPTYAATPVLYTIEVCNNGTAAEDVTLTEIYPLAFIPTSWSPAWPTAPVTVQPSQCLTYLVEGYYTQIGSHTNTATMTPVIPGASLSASATVDILEGCPMIVYGQGNCSPGSTIELCLGMHTQLSQVSSVSYYLVYPDFLMPPSPGALTVSSVFPVANATIGTPVPMGGWPAGYSAVPITVNFSSLVNASPPYEFFCLDFTVGPSGVPAGTNTAWIWASTTAPSFSGWNQVTVTTNGTPVDLWTQAYFVQFDGCSNVNAPYAAFTVDVPSCGGAVTVNATLQDPAAVHSWTWGDNRTTPTNGAPTWTYDYFAPIANNQGWPVNIAAAPPGTYTITHTVILNGVSSSTSQNITITECCQANTIIPDGSTATSVGTSFTGTVAIQGQFIVDDHVLFQNAQVYMEAGAEIIVLSGISLDLDNTSITACNGVMWRSITAQNTATVRVRDSFVDDAEAAITGLDGSVIWIDNTQFHNNRVGISVPDMGLPYNSVACWVSNSSFYSAGTMPQPYQGQTTAVGAKGYAAADVHYTAFDLVGGNNVIHSLSNGVVGHQSDVTVIGCSFLNIHGDPAYAFTGNGSGIYARGDQGWYTLKQGGTGMNGSPSFTDCRWGIYTDYMNVSSSDNNMAQVGTAYRVNYSSYRHIEVIMNRLDTRFNGIELMFNDGAAKLLVENNDITFASNPPPGQYTKGYVAIRAAEAGTPGPSSIIRNNLIHYRAGTTTARGGISLTSCREYLVAGNDLRMADNSVNENGIHLYDCEKCEVSCNNVLGATNGYPEPKQSAIRNFMGAGSLFSCNTLDRTSNGIIFNGAAYDTDVRGNFLHNHKWALHLDASAIIGSQSLRGNLWYAPPASGGIGAWYENTFNALSNPFFYSWAMTSGGNTEPPSWSPSTWFQLVAGINYDCADDHGANYCNQFTDTRCKECLIDLDEKIAGDSLENNPYTEETKWIFQGELYKKLKEYPSLLSDPKMADFYAEQQGSLMDQFKSIEEAQWGAFDIDPDVLATLQQNQEQVADLLPLVAAALEQLGDNNLSSAQRQLLLATVGGHQQSIRNLTTYNAAALKLAADTRALSADSVKASNSALGTTELIEANEKQVRGVYLATVAKDMGSFTAAQTTELFDIANQCPMIGGGSVFKARALYGLIDPEYDFDDALLCLPHGIIVKSLTEQQATAMNVVPNPASDEATLVLTEQLDAPGVFVLYDALGAEVMRYTLPVDMPRVTFSTTSLAPALYHYQVRGPSGILGVGKLTIVR